MRHVKRTVGTLATAAALALGVGVGASWAQNQEGLVNVNVSDVRVDIAKAINVEENQIPVNVQAPIGVAANVCNVAANVLAQQRKETGQAECTAQSTSQALNQIVQRQIKQ